MKKYTTFIKLIQTLLTEEEVMQLVKSTESIEYEEKGRKFTIYILLQYWICAAFEKWEGFRDGADRAFQSGLPSVDYSTFSKKASEVPYELLKCIFEKIVSKCNRTTRRKLKKALNDLSLIDSTTITVGKNRLKWALYHGERAGIKLHVSLDAETGLPIDVVESTARKHDGPIGEQLANRQYILVMDRAYGKIARFDCYAIEGQPFAVRLKGNVQLTDPQPLCQTWAPDSLVTQDITCYLGGDSCRSKQRHRVVFFKDQKGNEFRIVTNVMNASADEIAEMYKTRWEIEVFFRWIKQHLNVKRLFGTTRNAVYGQMYTALITYILLKWLYDEASPHIALPFQLSFVRFTRLLSLDHLSSAWMSKINEILKYCLANDISNIQNNP
jgi:IS4 transposase